MITEEQYRDMPEYWDYQRKIEYNKEKCMTACEKIMEHFGDVEDGKDAEEMFQTMWHKIEPEDYDEPPLDWIPKNVNRIPVMLNTYTFRHQARK